MKRACLFLATIISFVSSAAASGIVASPDMKTIVKAMKRGLQGPDDAVRIMNLKVISDGAPRQSGRQFRRTAMRMTPTGY